jgi:hypothetical protein
VKKDDYYQYALAAFRPAENMLKMISPDKLDYRPAPNFMSIGQLICHLGDGIGTELRMVINNSFPKAEEMSGPPELAKFPTCTVEEALSKLEKDKTTLLEILAGITEEEFATKIVSVPWGWTSNLERMALDFREHFVNHKMQLFTYLKLLGLPVNTQTLYFG